MGCPEYRNRKPSRFDDSINIPDDWGEKRLKFVVSHNDEVLPEATDPDYEIEYVDISSVNLVSGITAYETVSFEKAPSRARRIARDGDTLVSTVRTYLKAIAPVTNPPDNLVVSTGFAVIRPRENIDQGYLSYFLQNQNFVELVVANSVGVSYPAINASDLVCIPSYFPNNIEEQQKIATFLDYKTQQIDQLIEKKKALIEKLEEKRIAVITQAVTKGLDKNAKLKPSGVDWLGDVPEHWDVVSVRYVTEFVTSGSRGWADYFAEQGNPFLRITNLTRNTIQLKLDDIQRVMPPDGSEGERTQTISGDVLVSITADLGSVAVIPETLERSYVSQHVALVRPDSSRVLSKWLAYSYLSDFGKFQLMGAGYGGTKIQLGLGDVKKVLVALPPTVDEQEKVLLDLDSEINKIDLVLTAVRKAQKILQEYRSAIITSAVTGKIDVRKVEIPKEAA